MVVEGVTDPAIISGIMDTLENSRITPYFVDPNISRLLGHEDVQTTQKRYAHHCTESLRIGVDILMLTTFGEKEGFLGASKLS
ncbi:MAG: hypothetical protein HOI47_02165 [Candidatus Scalindua sp.]|nr:hypothetical protein [Candidatus Scalindua sp.]MBT6225441.1 hypothetical protein [Candidatus Scalindua sp.]MBT7212330.1 hypothetical protein [Candidatus Scalindua sp.]MBT7590529.1 hypothetical protein [Candidatus Scalindua sp.]